MQIFHLWIWIYNLNDDIIKIQAKSKGKPYMHECEMQINNAR